MNTSLTFPKSRKLFLTSKIILLFSFLLVSLHFSHAQQPSRFEMNKPADVPGYKLQVMMEMRGEPHRQFGSWVAGLGDVNKDGGNDFAVGTGGDTTFIYFGGKGILDDIPDLFVFGGASKIVAADYNGDGWIDIATSATTLRAEKSNVRIYLNNKTPTVYNTTPDVEIKGTADKELGREMLAGDFDGDGKDDLLVSSHRELYIPQQGKIYLYFGKDISTSTFDWSFELPRDTSKTGGFAIYGDFFSVGNYNGDSLDDIAIRWDQPRQTADPIYNYKIFFGNRDRKFDVSDYDLSGKFYPFLDERIYLVDINGEGKDELHFTNFQTRQHSIVWGRTNGIPSALPDTIFPNPEPAAFRYSGEVIKCNDMNGDFFPDYIVRYVAYLDANAVYLFRGGSKWDKKAVGYAILDWQEIQNWYGVVPLKDIDGDGVDDLSAFIRVPTATSKGFIRFFKGDRKITQVRSQNTPDDFSLRVFPNPVASTATIEYYLPASTRISLKLYDNLGKLITVLDEGEKRAGSYQLRIDKGLFASQTMFCVLATEGKRSLERITVLK